MGLVIPSLSNPTNLVFNQLVKGYQITLYNIILLAEGNKQLRTANERQKKKKSKRMLYIVTREILTIQKRLNWSQIISIGPVDKVADAGLEPKSRAPQTCSICKSPEHTARTCPSKGNFNLDSLIESV